LNDGAGIGWKSTYFSANVPATSGEEHMNDDFNMSMRKFLKQVGVTSQKAIEDAMRGADTNGKAFTAKAVITVEGLGVEHVVTGTIKGQD
jgi:hypothetical protein